ncbi:MAG: DUF192 domain-containing protein [Chloroflexota bacterium]
MKKIAGLLLSGFGLLVVLVAYGCGGAVDTPAAVATSTALPTATVAAAPTSAPSEWVPPTALVGTPIPGAVATLTAAPQLQTGKLTITNSAGEKTVVTVEIADTEAARSLGLMFRSSMQPDAGMLFDFNGETTGGFWMQNTILPLSIAFIQQDGTIVNVADMEPLNTNTVEAAGPYYYALEANQGFYAAHNIKAGDKVTLPVDTAAIIPGMPSCDR